MSDDIDLLQSETPENTRPDFLPAKFWDEKTGTVRLDALVKSYAALEQKLSSKETRPALPESADLYELDLADDLIQSDPEVNARLHAKGFTNDQVQEVYDLARERLVPLILDMARDIQADRELEKIIAHFGGAESWARLSRQMLAFGRKNLDPQTLRVLASSFDGVITLHRMMLEATGQSRLEGAGRANGKAAIDEQALAKMMKDPRYWRDRDPKFIGQVTEGFQQLYS